MLNAGGEGSISGFTVRHGSLSPIPGSTRSLGLGNASPPVFINAPAQIGFSADGRTLIVTTKSHNELLSFPVDRRGLPSAAPVVTPSARAMPFSSAGTGLNALCWNIQVGGTVHGVNAGSATLSAWSDPARGVAVLTASVAATTGNGPIDLAASADGRFLYIQESVDGTIGGYAVARDGSLTRIQTVTGPPAFGTSGMRAFRPADLPCARPDEPRRRRRRGSSPSVRAPPAGGAPMLSLDAVTRRGRG